jgi:deazaflavin-dependent oxidoreductase (nitroreductase family)
MPSAGEGEPSASRRSRDQVALYESSGGTRGTSHGGRLVVVVTMVGAGRGKLRKAPVMRVERDGRYAVVASMGGAPTNPYWYAKVRANPRVELQDGPVRRGYVACEVTGEGRAQRWERVVETFPPCAGYQIKAARVIPVFVVEPVPEQST